MTVSKDAAPPPKGKRDENRQATQHAIETAVLDALASGDAMRLNHDRIAERTGIARRTIYRYFPDQQALLNAAWSRVTERAGPNVRMPATEADLVGSLDDIYTGFDRIEPIAIITRSTPQGRAMRLSQKQRRQECYTAAAADAVRDLPPEDRLLATAMLQVLHTTPWLEMHDHWDLSGEQMARVCGWAIRTLLADLRRRGTKPLDQGPG